MRRTAVTVALVSVCAIALGLAGCGGDDADDGAREDSPPAAPLPEERTAEGEAPTQDELVGLWVIEGHEPPRLMRFDAEGGFAIDDRGQLDSAPAAAGSYELDGNQLRFETRGSEICTNGDSWMFEVGRPDDSLLHMVVKEDAEGPCSQGVGAEWDLSEQAE